MSILMYTWIHICICLHLSMRRAWNVGVYMGMDVYMDMDMYMDVGMV